MLCLNLVQYISQSTIAGRGAEVKADDPGLQLRREGGKRTVFWKGERLCVFLEDRGSFVRCWLSVNICDTLAKSYKGNTVALAKAGSKMFCLTEENCKKNLK